MFSIISLYSSYFTSISYFYLIIMVFTIFRLSIYQVGFSEGGIREWVRLGTCPKVNSNKESYASFQRRTNILESSFPMNRTFEHFNSHDMNVRQVNMAGNGPRECMIEGRESWGQFWDKNESEFVRNGICWCMQENFSKTLEQNLIWFIFQRSNIHSKNLLEIRIIQLLKQSVSFWKIDLSSVLCYCFQTFIKL